MKFTLIVVLALVSCTLAMKSHKAATTIKDMKAKAVKKSHNDDTDSAEVSAQMISTGKIFGYARNKDKKSGSVVAKVSKKAVMVDMTPGEQQRKWFDLADSKFPFKAGGFSQWRPTRTGLVFRTADEKNSMVCESSKHSGDNTSAVFRFHCDEPTTISPRFAESRYYNYWMPTTDGTPYGWSNYWDNFGYSYWSMGPRGYYGCNSLVYADWCPSSYSSCSCSGRAAYYPYSNCGDDDCYPWNNYYSSYYLPYCSSCNYVAPTYYNGCSECAPSFTTLSLNPNPNTLAH